MKKYLVLIFIFCILAATYISPVYGEINRTIYEKSSEIIIAKGATLKSIQQFTTKGWKNIHVLKIDLTENHLEIDSLFDTRGIRYANDLLNISDNEKTIAAVNGDYFSKLSQPMSIAWPVGTLIDEGKIITTHTYPEEKFATIGFTKDNSPLFAYWNSSINVTAANGKRVDVHMLNKYYSADNLASVIMYDSNWDTKSVGSDGLYKGITEVVIENSVVKEIRKDMPGAEIPENGFILAAIPQYNNVLDENFKVGDTVKVEMETTPDWKAIKTAVGGGTLLLKDGQIHPITWKNYGKNPFTAIGVDQWNKYMYIVTVDGRQSISIGMTQQELAAFMKDLGCYNAIQMDGGGSTTLATRLPGEQQLSIVNSPSDGKLRAISTGLGIKNNAPKSSLKSLIVEPAYQNVFVNTSLSFTVKGYDANYNPVPVDPSKIRWQVQGISGTFNDNKFYPTSVGYGTITAIYNNVSGSANIYALSAPVELIMTPSEFYRNSNESLNVKIEGKNKNGYIAPISNSDINWSFQNGAVEVQGDKIKPLKPGGGIIKASINDVSVHGIVSSSGKKIVNDFESSNGTFIGYPAEVTGAYTLSSSIVKSGKAAGKLTFDFSADIAASKAAYFKLDKSITMDKNVSKIGLWVYSHPEYSHWLRAQVTDANGNIFRLSLARSMDWEGWKYVETALPENAAYPLSLDRIYIVQTDQTVKGIGTIYLDDITFSAKNTPASLEVPQDTKYTDPLNRPPETPKGHKPFKFMVFGKTIQSKTLLDNIIMKKVIGTANKKSDLALFAGFNDPNTLSELKIPIILTKGYGSKVIENNLFIWLDSTKRSLRETDESQWFWLKEQISSVRADNVFIAMPSPLDGENGFTDKLEANLLKDMLTEEIVQKQNKNVFFLYNGNENNNTIYRGIRYLSTVGIEDIHTDNLVQKIDDLQYILITVDGTNVTYEIKRLFE